ncbi:MAG: hypothetical protein OT477_21040 [Chloroflexi bacterium]|nr:hypothetical protein [Chloroflexota bacterium]
MIIPNAEDAIVDIRKLRDYCLNPLHEDGKHKARLFYAILGMTAADAYDLQQILLEVVAVTPARLGKQDAYGQRYTVDFLMEWHGKQALVRSGWIVETDIHTPKLTSCYPL